MTVEPEAPKAWAYAAALVVTIVCLALANVVVAWFGGLAGVQAGKPAAAVLAFVQGLAGALLAAFLAAGFTAAGFLAGAFLAAGFFAGAFFAGFLAVAI